VVFAFRPLSWKNLAAAARGLAGGQAH
jgi:hypothetical protein